MSAKKHYTTAPEDRISLKQKMAYSVGMLVNNLQAAAMPAMVVILNLGLGMDVLWVGLIGAIPRIFDAISDPLVGYISDNSRSRWGRRRPFIFAGALSAGLIFAIMWQLPSGYIDFLKKEPVRKHQTIVETQESAVFNNAGGVELAFSDSSSNASFVFYGPKIRALAENQSSATDLDGFPQVELNVLSPKGSEISLMVYESAPLNPESTADGEIYALKLGPENSKAAGSSLYTFALADLDLLASSGNEPGNGVLDLQAIDRVVVEVAGLSGAGTTVVQSIKFKKADSFYVFWFWLFLFMSILFFLAYTVYATPFVAFGYEMTADYHEHSRTIGLAGCPMVLCHYVQRPVPRYGPWCPYPGHCGRCHRCLVWHPASDLPERASHHCACCRGKQRTHGQHEGILCRYQDHPLMLTLCQDLRHHLSGIQWISVGYVLLHLCHDLLSLRWERW